MNDELGLDDEYEDDEFVINLSKKDTYTPCTKEAFLEWKKKFDNEIYELKKQRGDLKNANDDKLTGRQLFERDAKLIASDALGKDEDDIEENEYVRKEEEKEEEDEENLEEYEDLFDQDVDVDDI
eukprot:CAMPEP_0114592310 /NCGR_PEP_ID=MMETSP0125-20121206/14163_1 /TAXON_ID=485358 ORGANISM="Aristerostoma sp., Strain ATCC 50986" /NCGR_SAMPLE_ID=MMETSP0125 /ASSEMBLY_ACC=CAM_ASM_000245 /LENGTH=124 /DNA_ID=CAMNT_0001790879 /DNA_START=417 /DNA_END=791 /DNA_ORIENTATION=+